MRRSTVDGVEDLRLLPPTPTAEFNALIGRAPMVEAIYREEVVVMATLTSAPEAEPRTRRRNLLRHYVEMVLAMIAGMAVLGAAVRLVCAAFGYSEFVQHAGLRAPVMAANMTIGMAVWMRYRGHRWAPIGEMGAAMFVPLLVLIGPFWAGALSGDMLSGAMHVLMLPAMALAMLYRRDEYAQDHRRHRAPLSAPSAATSVAI